MPETFIPEEQQQADWKAPTNGEYSKPDESQEAAKKAEVERAMLGLAAFLEGKGFVTQASNKQNSITLEVLAANETQKDREDIHVTKDDLWLAEIRDVVKEYMRLRGYEVNVATDDENEVATPGGIVGKKGDEYITAFAALLGPNEAEISIIPADELIWDAVEAHKQSSEG